MAKRGRKRLDVDERRVKVVDVYFTAAEMAALDTDRGQRGRAEHIRRCVAGAVPAPVPALNVQTASDLGRAFGNLSALAAASRRGGFIQERDLLQSLIELRNLLLIGKAQLTKAGEDE